MSADRERIEQLEEAYRRLWEQHQELKEEIRRQYSEVEALREQYGIPAKPAIQQSTASSKPAPTQQPVQQAKAKSGWEQYIGEQVLSKIGIAILIIGVGIGAKYAIDHELLSPVMRIAGGYIVAAILGFFAWRFKNKYEGFSAVLVSGSMAVCYFITYAAYSFYQLFPYGMAFVLLLLTTIGTVLSALRYNQVMIAHIGLIGAYILPALIANKTAHLSNYLAYMTVINTGILFISFLRSWRSLVYVAFGWSIFVFPVWFFTSYKPHADATIAMCYIIGYFLLFQTAVLAYPLLRRKPFEYSDLLVVIPNVLGLLAIGNYILYAADAGANSSLYFGTFIGAVLLGIAFIFRKIRPEDKLLSGVHELMAICTLLIVLSFSSVKGIGWAVRYVDFFAIVALLLLRMRRGATTPELATLLHLLLLWALSLEMTHLLTETGNRNAYRLSLSILWGLYAVYILFSGIKHNSAALRVTAMIILGITLVKLFFFDIVQLSTLSKTILFLALGSLLLVGAYFYQRFKSDS